MYAMLILGIVMAVYAMLGCTVFATADPYHFGSFSRSYFTMFQVARHSLLAVLFPSNTVMILIQRRVLNHPSFLLCHH
jgi:hypothetical protein